MWKWKLTKNLEEKKNQQDVINVSSNFIERQKRQKKYQVCS